MILAFKNALRAAQLESGLSKVFSLGISRVTHGKYSHVEIGLYQNPDLTYHCFASREPTGTGFQDLDLSDSTLWHIITIPTTPLQDSLIQAWCQGCDLRPYNFIAIAGLLTDKAWTEPHDMICSQCAAKLLQNILHWFPTIPCWSIAPDGFEGDSKRHGLLELVESHLTLTPFMPTG